MIEDRTFPGSVLEIQNIALTPAQPEPGKQVRLDLEGELSEPVDLREVTTEFTVKLGMVKLMHRSCELPELLAMLGGELSGDAEVPAGPFARSWTLRVPKDAPRGRLQITLRAETSAGEELADLNFRLDFQGSRVPS
ncbi:hypothetical protein DPM19_03020 [Actinomadura craniellae]|uniref:Uncharacterized protein n=1 Tax=Actinomadura craniellae TaxID=2231787 RepID=A0A365HDD9_9ACTN|nr:hypothetical protein DPM19_03020 [Actinomadura craniellae]